ncbi:MAG TPA: isoprenylcysteine carboxylmethyltransferase family protein [Steroidobacteraceae bacterium]|jgi:protein-S-isoprenylcysteine O-methyltransferase Ste14|nr:isoprenylcysteine carboxylmethyltransferase family protein [Steroidobacteraceae bacterium]
MALLNLYCGTVADPPSQGFIALTESASTPRLRATFAIYLALVAAATVVGPDAVSPAWYYVSGVLGFLCVALACLGRIWSSVFIAGHKDVDLVTTGPYARCRHPLYACSILGAVGLGLTSRSMLLCAIVVVFISALVIYAAACEEQFLADAFPDAFREYLAATPNKWLPGRRKTALPEHLDVHPAVFWKSFLDAGSFFALYLLVAFAAEYRLSPG